MLISPLLFVLETNRELEDKEKWKIFFKIAKNTRRENTLTAKNAKNTRRKFNQDYSIQNHLLGLNFGLDWDIDLQINLVVEFTSPYNISDWYHDFGDIIANCDNMIFLIKIKPSQNIGLYYLSGKGIATPF